MNNNNTIDTSAYWNDRYIEKSDHWSLNNPNPVFVQFLEKHKITDGNKLLVLGSALGHDAMSAAQLGYDVTGIDFSIHAIEKSRRLCAGLKNPPEFILMDLFELVKTEMKFNLIYEYVTMCSFNPNRIENFLINVDSVLEKGGIFVSVLFPLKEVGKTPPYQIDLLKFNKQAGKHWKLQYYQKNVNSVKPRKHNEILIIYKKA